MRTIILVVVGLVLLLIVLMVTQRSGRRASARASLIFLLIWLLVSAANAWYGITQLDNSLVTEVLFALVIFLPAAIPASIIWFKNRKAVDRPRRAP